MLERTFDYRKVKKFWPKEEQGPIISSKFIYLLDSDKGMWTFHSYKNGFRIHANMSAKLRGKKAIESAKNAFRWIFSNTKKDIIYAIIPKKNRAACLVASMSGMDFIDYQEDNRIFEVKKWAA